MQSRRQLTKQNLNNNKSSKNEVESKTLKQIMNQIMNNKLYSQPICSDMLLNLVNKVIQQSKRNKKLQQLMQEQTYDKTIQFTSQYCYSMLDRFIRKHKSKPNYFQQQQLLIPVGAEFAFLNHDSQNNSVNQQLQNDIKNNSSIKRISKRNSSFNINKVFVIKRQSNLNPYVNKQNNNTNELKNIQLNELNCSGTKNVLNNSTNRVIKVQTRRLSVNPLIKDQINNNKQLNFISNQSFGSKKTLRSDKINKLIRLQSTDEQKSQLIKQHHEQKNKNENQPFQQQHINFLRSRKFKLQNMMKDFDEHQLIKNNNKNNYLQASLSKQNAIQNIIQKRNVINTDYNGNVIQMKNKNIQHIYGNNGQHNNITQNKQKPIKTKNQINTNSYIKKHHNHNRQDSQNNFQKTMMEKVNFCVKDYHYDVNNIFSQIFSSIKTGQIGKITNSRNNKKGTTNQISNKQNNVNQKLQKETIHIKDKQNRNSNQSSALPSVNALKSNIKKDQHNQNTKHKKVALISNDGKQNHINQKFKQHASNRKSNQKIQIQQTQKQLKISEHKGQLTPQDQNLIHPRGYKYRKSIMLKNQIFSQKDLKKNKLLNQNQKKSTNNNRKDTIDDNQSISSHDIQYQKQKNKKIKNIKNIKNIKKQKKVASKQQIQNQDSKKRNCLIFLVFSFQKLHFDQNCFHFLQFFILLYKTIN